MKKDILMYFRRNKVRTFVDDDGKKSPIFEMGRACSMSDPRGGVTVSGLIANEGSEIRWGICRCDSRDNFNRRKGRMRAVGLSYSRQAIITLNYDYPIAKQIAELLARTPKKFLADLNVEAYIDDMKKGTLNFPNPCPLILKK